MSGMNRFKRRRIGIRRKRSTSIRKRNNCQMPHAGVYGFGVKSDQGMIEPKMMNMLELSTRSTMVGKGAERIFLENQPSCANPIPAPKATRKSSVPVMEPTPTERMAKRR